MYICRNLNVVIAVAMSSASADLFGEDEEADQLRVLAMEDSDEIVKSKPDSALLQVSGLRAEKEDTAVSKLVMLKEKCEDLEVDIVSREKVEEKDSYIRYKIFVKVGFIWEFGVGMWRGIFSYYGFENMKGCGSFDSIEFYILSGQDFAEL